MPADPPVNFEEKVKLPKGQTNAEYPYALKATDLMRNFVFATLEIEKGVFEETTGMGGHKQRKLSIPSPPSSGTHVLGAISGTIQWIATEDCA